MCPICVQTDPEQVSFVRHRNIPGPELRQANGSWGRAKQSVCLRLKQGGIKVIPLSPVSVHSVAVHNGGLVETMSGHEACVQFGALMSDGRRAEE